MAWPEQLQTRQSPRANAASEAWMQHGSDPLMPSFSRALDLMQQAAKWSSWTELKTIASELKEQLREVRVVDNARKHELQMSITRAQVAKEQLSGAAVHGRRLADQVMEEQAISTDLRHQMESDAREFVKLLQSCSSLEHRLAAIENGEEDDAEEDSQPVRDWRQEEIDSWQRLGHSKSFPSSASPRSDSHKHSFSSGAILQTVVEDASGDWEDGGMDISPSTKLGVFDDESSSNIGALATLMEVATAKLQESKPEAEPDPSAAATSDANASCEQQEPLPAPTQDQEEIDDDSHTSTSEKSIVDSTGLTKGRAKPSGSRLKANNDTPGNGGFGSTGGTGTAPSRRPKHSCTGGLQDPLRGRGNGDLVLGGRQKPKVRGPRQQEPKTAAVESEQYDQSQRSGSSATTVACAEGKTDAPIQPTTPSPDVRPVIAAATEAAKLVRARSQPPEVAASVAAQPISVCTVLGQQTLVRPPGQALPGATALQASMAHSNPQVVRRHSVEPSLTSSRTSNLEQASPSRVPVRRQKSAGATFASTVTLGALTPGLHGASTVPTPRQQSLLVEPVSNVLGPGISLMPQVYSPPASPIQRPTSPPMPGSHVLGDALLTSRPSALTPNSPLMCRPLSPARPASPMQAPLRQLVHLQAGLAETAASNLQFLVPPAGGSYTVAPPAQASALPAQVMRLEPVTRSCGAASPRPVSQALRSPIATQTGSASPMAPQRPRVAVAASLPSPSASAQNWATGSPRPQPSSPLLSSMPRHSLGSPASRQYPPTASASPQTKPLTSPGKESQPHASNGCGGPGGSSILDHCRSRDEEDAQSSVAGSSVSANRAGSRSDASYVAPFQLVKDIDERRVTNLTPPAPGVYGREVKSAGAKSREAPMSPRRSRAMNEKPQRSPSSQAPRQERLPGSESGSRASAQQTAAAGASTKASL
eukprot:TRINITY_DN75846_c0_g1_i1.p1 TRINITY_DN75846_c0_g1~~TRINITY_DN75846_c0_g1_i1.p1  ORF type:complete len:940 (+),score=187.01 TRINITY_DN75846_c0_g1_i1:22-2820(+)